MRILFVSQYFYPETFRGNDIVFELVKKGHVVTVLTSKPNYPKGKFYKGYSFLNRREEFINGARILRVPIIPRGSGNGLFIFINYSSFIFFSYFACLFRIHESYDIIFVQQLSPVTMALPALWIKNIKKIPLCLWVLDLWPESVSSASKIRNKYILKFLDKVVRKIYNASDLILISSNFFRSSIGHKILDKQKPIIYFPNWAEDIFLLPVEYKSDKIIPSFPSGTNIMFAGNVGEAQDFESIINAAEITQFKNENINWIIVGDGRKIAWIKKEICNRKLTNVFLYGRYNLEDMPFLISKADIMLVSLKDTPSLNLTVPAKLQAYMASSKIILGMINGEANEIINIARCGISVRAGDFENLANNVVLLSRLSLKERRELESNSLEYYKNNFDKNSQIEKLERYMTETLIKWKDFKFRT